MNGVHFYLYLSNFHHKNVENCYCYAFYNIDNQPHVRKPHVLNLSVGPRETNLWDGRAHVTTELLRRG